MKYDRRVNPRPVMRHRSRQDLVVGTSSHHEVHVVLLELLSLTVSVVRMTMLVATVIVTEALPLRLGDRCSHRASRVSRTIATNHDPRRIVLCQVRA